jgi:hypothetical protein
VASLNAEDRARREITALRLSAQRISRDWLKSPADVVRWMLAMQAQDFPGAKWSVALRTQHATDPQVESALAAGEIVRSWPMRGTLHFVAPEDLWWILGITGPRQRNLMAKRRRDLEISDRELALAADVAARELTGGRVIRRDRLLEAWDSAGISPAGQRGYHLIWNLAQERHLVFGPVDGKQQTFALFGEWITSSRDLDGDAALAELATRYFCSHGPATERDFAWWASITLGQARRGIAASTGLERRELGGVTYYLSEGLEPAGSDVAALSGFDEYVLGYQDRTAALTPERFERIVPGGNGIFYPTLVIDGEIVGTWKRSETAKAIVVTVEPFVALSSRAKAGFTSAMARYEAFMAKPLEVRFP